MKRSIEGARGGAGRSHPALAMVLAALALTAACAQPEPSSALDDAREAAALDQSEPSPSPGAGEPATPDPPGVDLPAGDDVTLERVVDGDTIVVSGGERVRLIGIDTPETVHPSRPVECFGPEASAHLASLLPPGETVRLVYDVERRDRFGRTLAYVWRLDGLDVNQAMVADGFAMVYTVPPNVARQDDFLAAQRAARDQERGLWGSDCPDATGEAGASSAADVPPEGSQKGCDPAYPDQCIPPPPPVLGCRDIPHRRFTVLPPDPHAFDGDGDGIGCQS